MAMTWTGASAAEANTWRSIAYAPSLNLFAAISSDGTNQVMTSPDGVTWTSRSAASASTWYSVAWSESLGIFAAVGDNAAMSSTDGITWTSRTPASTDTWKYVTFGDGIFVAVNDELSTTGAVMTSSNGTSWTLQTTPSVSGMQCAAYSPALDIWVVLSGSGAGSGTSAMSSPDGVTWTARTIDNTVQWWRVAWSPELATFVAISGASGVATSTNGTTWSAVTDLGSATLTDIVWSSALSRFVLLTQSPIIYTSTDGSVWDEFTDQVENSFWQAICTAEELSNVVAVSATGTQRVFIGIAATTAAADDDTGWYKSNVPGLESGVDATIVNGASARPTSPRGMITTSPFSESNPALGYPGHAVAFNNRMIYAGGDYTIGTDLPPIRVWNGTSDYQLCTVPRDGSGNIPKCITTMVNGDGAIYLGTWDTGTTSSNVAGRILKLDANSGQLTNVGNVNTLTGYIPWALWFHNGELWAGLHRSDTSAGRIYRIKPNEQTSWTQDRDLSSDSVGPCTVISAYKGKMYFGSAAASGTFAKFGSRDTSATYALVYTGTGGTAQNYNGFYAATVFGDNLYFSYWNPDTTKVSLIKKYDGSSVTTAKDVTTVASVPIIALFVHDGVLYAAGSRRVDGNYTSVLLTTTDGTTWTDRTGDLPTTGFGSTGLTNAFASIAY